MLATLVETNLRTYCALAPAAAESPAILVVGVSGGADSLALLHALVELQPQGNVVHVAHFDHGLRPDSAADAHFVADQATALGVPFHLGHARPGELRAAGGNLEQAARRARYRFLLQTALNATPAAQVPWLLTAHHALDQAETVLLHLTRGSGLAGLGGMRWVTEMRLSDFAADSADSLEPAEADDARPVRVARPLLDVTPATLCAALTARNSTWRTDPTNADTGLARNRVRHEILPNLTAINPQAVSAIGRMAQIVREDADRLAAADAARLDSLLLAFGSHSSSGAPSDPPVARIVLDLTTFLSLSRPEQRGVIRQALARLRGALQDVALGPVEAMLALLAQHGHAGGPHPLLDDVAWTVASLPISAPMDGALVAGGPALSLHRIGASPFPATVPQLPADFAPMTLTSGDHLALADWQLDVRTYPRSQLPDDWSTVRRAWRSFFDAELAQPLQLASLSWVGPGLCIAPLGMGGRHKRIGDVMTDSKAPVAYRPHWPLILGPDRNSRPIVHNDSCSSPESRVKNRAVLWVCGLATSHLARITPTTTQVVELTWTRRLENVR